MGESWNKDKQWVWKEKGENKGGKCVKSKSKVHIKQSKAWESSLKFLSKSNPHEIKPTDARKRKTKVHFSRLVNANFSKTAGVTLPVLLLVEHVWQSFLWMRPWQVPEQGLNGCARGGGERFNSHSSLSSRHSWCTHRVCCEELT